MPPIRVGLIGLTTSSNPAAAGAWAANAHLPILRSSPDYKVVALCNSTVEKAEKSKAHHKLADTVRCYGSPQELAADPEVDLVSVVVDVEKHFDLTMPALRQGKDVFVEWPLARTVKEAEAMTKLAREKSVNTFVGLQAQADPAILKAKEIIASGDLGDVLSSFADITSDPSFFNILPESAKYFVLLESGGNLLTITFGHFLHTFVSLLGHIGEIQSTLKLVQPNSKLVNNAGEVLDEDFQKTRPDHIFVQGSLSSGAPLSLNLRSVNSSIRSGFRWVISGTKAEIEITGQGMMWQMGGLKLALKKVGGDVEELELAQTVLGIDVAEYPPLGINTARTYQAFADGNAGVFVDFETATKTQQLLDQILAAAGWKTSAEWDL